MNVTMSVLPETGYVRLSQLVGNPKANPPIPGILPVSKSTIWQWVKQGIFPRPIKLGPRVSVFDVQAVRSCLESKALQENA